MTKPSNPNRDFPWLDPLPYPVKFEEGDPLYTHYLEDQLGLLRRMARVGRTSAQLRGDNGTEWSMVEDFIAGIFKGVRKANPQAAPSEGRKPRFDTREIRMWQVVTAEGERHDYIGTEREAVLFRESEDEAEDEAEEKREAEKMESRPVTSEELLGYWDRGSHSLQKHAEWKRRMEALQSRQSR